MIKPYIERLKDIMGKIRMSQGTNREMWINHLLGYIEALLVEVEKPKT